MLEEARKQEDLLVLNRIQMNQFLRCGRPLPKRLGESKFTAPHFYLTLDIDMDNAIGIRQSMNTLDGIKISYNDMVIKACAIALREHPAVNSSWMGDFIRRNDHVHVGVAVAR